MNIGNLTDNIREIFFRLFHSKCSLITSLWMKNMVHSKKECTIYINKVLISYFTGIASMRAW